jgi:hypothetical protein
MRAFSTISFLRRTHPGFGPTLKIVRLCYRTKLWNNWTLCINFQVIHIVDFAPVASMRFELKEKQDNGKTGQMESPQSLGFSLEVMRRQHTYFSVELGCIGIMSRYFLRRTPPAESTGISVSR